MRMSLSNMHECESSDDKLRAAHASATRLHTGLMQASGTCSFVRVSVAQCNRQLNLWGELVRRESFLERLRPLFQVERSERRGQKNELDSRSRDTSRLPYYAGAKKVSSVNETSLAG